MPLKRKFERNEGKRLHQRNGSGLFSYAGGLPERKPQESPDQLPNKPQEPQGTQPNLPTLQALNSKIS